LRALLSDFLPSCLAISFKLNSYHWDLDYLFSIISIPHSIRLLNTRLIVKERWQPLLMIRAVQVEKGKGSIVFVYGLPERSSSVQHSSTHRKHSFSREGKLAKTPFSIILQFRTLNHHFYSQLTLGFAMVE